MNINNSSNNNNTILFETFDIKSGLGLILSNNEDTGEFEFHVYNGGNNNENKDQSITNNNNNNIIQVNQEEFSQFYYCCLPLFFDNPDFIEKVNNGEIKLENGKA
jgi:hypothetical protein